MRTFWPWMVAWAALLGVMAWSLGPGGMDFITGAGMFTIAAVITVAAILRRHAS